MKKDNRGFTLVELLGVIVILILIMILVLSNVIKSVKSKKDEVAILDNQIIYSAAKMYIDDNEKKYPKIDGNTYCISTRDLKEKDYLKDELNPYDEDITEKFIEAIYENGYSLAIVDDCVPVSVDDSKCKDGEGLCSACYVSKKYNEEKNVYKYEHLVLEEVKTSKLINGDNLSYVSNLNDCIKLSILSAAKQYAYDNPKSYKRKKGYIYCIPIEDLINFGYLNLEKVLDWKEYTVSLEYNNNDFVGQIVTDGSCVENLPCGSDIDIPENFLPVKYDENIREWIATSEDDPDWYDYDDRKWANAVVLKPDINKNVGDIVDVIGTKTDISFMFVYIPRYSFTIKRTYDSSRNIKSFGYQGVNAKTISSDIYFGGIDVKCVSKSVKERGRSYYEGATPSEWYTMPAFSLSNSELNGIWVSKFLISAENEAYDYNVNCNEESCSGAENLRSLPNRHELTGDKTSAIEMFFGALLGMNNNSYFGTKSSNYKFHMIKNDEYAALLYFTRSKYGKYDNPDYTMENKEVYKVDENYSGQSCLFSSACSKKYMYDIGIKQDQYTKNTTSYDYIANYTESLSSKISKTNSNSYRTTTGKSDTDFTLSFTVPEGSIGEVSFDYTSYYDGKDTSVLYLGTTFEFYRDDVRLSAQKDNRNIGDTKSVNYKNLIPGTYSFKFYYYEVREAVLFPICSKLGDSSFDPCYAEFNNFKVIITPSSGYTKTTLISQKNGTGASTTGNIYGIYDFYQNQVVSARLKKEMSSDFISKYSDYMNLYDSKDEVSKACGGSWCTGHGLSDLSPGGLTSYDFILDNYWIKRNTWQSWFAYEMNNSGILNRYRITLFKE